MNRVSNFDSEYEKLSSSPLFENIQSFFRGERKKVSLELFITRQLEKINPQKSKELRNALVNFYSTQKKSQLTIEEHNKFLRNTLGTLYRSKQNLVKRKTTSDDQIVGKKRKSREFENSSSSAVRPPRKKYKVGEDSGNNPKFEDLMKDEDEEVPSNIRLSSGTTQKNIPQSSASSKNNRGSNYQNIPRIRDIETPDLRRRNEYLGYKRASGVRVRPSPNRNLPSRISGSSDNSESTTDITSSSVGNSSLSRSEVESVLFSPNRSRLVVKNGRVLRQRRFRGHDFGVFNEPSSLDNFRSHQISLGSLKYVIMIVFFLLLVFLGVYLYDKYYSNNVKILSFDGDEDYVTPINRRRRRNRKVEYIISKSDRLRNQANQEVDDILDNIYEDYGLTKNDRKKLKQVTEGGKDFDKTIELDEDGQTIKIRKTSRKTIRETTKRRIIEDENGNVYLDEEI